MDNKINIQNNLCTLENIACPICGCKETKHILTGRDMLHNIEGEFNIVECVSCGLQRTNPRPTPETIGVYYPSDYAPYNSEINISNTKNWKSKIRNFLGFDVKILPLASGKLYEIGCSNGNYLYEMRDKGWNILGGLEYSEYSANIAREKGFDIEVSSLENAQGPKEKVDILVAWMVIEHLHHPVEALTKIQNWINKDGYMVASIPFPSIFSKYIFKELSFDLQLPTHLFHYSSKSLPKLLEKSGWELVSIRYQANPMTFLKSFRYFANEKDNKLLKRFCDFMIDNPKSGKIRMILGWILKVTKQSGRIEFTARPKVASENS